VIDERPVTVAAFDLDLLEILNGPRFAGVCDFLADGFGMAYAALVLVDEESVWFCGRRGFTDDVSPREGEVWDIIMAAPGVLTLDTATDPRFAGTQVRIGAEAVRSIVSHVFHTPDGEAVGALVLGDTGVGNPNWETLPRLPELISWIGREIAAARELDRAAEVQRALLPKVAPPLPGFEIAGSCVPAKEVGGDFYDWYPIEGGIAFTLADVMGKGVGAGIIAATVRATVRSASRKKNVVAAVQRAAETLSEDLSEAASFVTLFHARLRCADGRLTYVDAGHGLTVIARADGTNDRLSGGDLPLGALSTEWARNRRCLEPGDTLVTFSDGVLDLFDESLEAIEAIADLARTAPSAAAAAAAIERLALRDNAPDDVTALVVRRLTDDGGAP
jgi:hypothetical protein